MIHFLMVFIKYFLQIVANGVNINNDIRLGRCRMYNNHETAQPVNWILLLSMSSLHCLIFAQFAIFPSLQAWLKLLIKLIQLCVLRRLLDFSVFSSVTINWKRYQPETKVVLRWEQEILSMKRWRFLPRQMTSRRVLVNSQLCTQQKAEWS